MAPKSNPSENLTLLRKAFGAFDPYEALPIHDGRYVDFSVERGTTELMVTMARNIRFASGSACQLLCGHRGCGKTTEINQLRHELETGDPPYFVVYCESDAYLDINDIDYPDVLLALTHQLNLDCPKGVKLSPGKFKTFWEELKAFMSAVVIPSKVKARGGPLEFEFDIKLNPDNRRKVREHLRPRATTFLEAVNEIIDKATEQLNEQYPGGIVVIMDNLDRLFRNVIPGSGQTNHDSLFIDASDYLRGVKCHVVYTIPPPCFTPSMGPS
jgi:hypothetical protein